jgi:F-box/leucine-rich repeat protein 10/11
MKSWTDYYDQSPEKRSKLLNVISLEFSHTALEKYVESPSIVRNSFSFFFNQFILGT